MRSILAIFCIIFTTHAFGINLRDSIGVENNNGKQLILHRVAARETYYSIGRLYNVLPKNIMDLNKVKVLQPGLTLKVPTERPYETPGSTPASTASAPADDLIDYKVGPKETLFAIARRFNTNVDEIKRLNNLTDNNLSVGQIIKVRQGGGAQPSVITGPQDGPNPAFPVVLNPDSLNADAVKVPVNRYGVAERTERGIAVWIEDEHLNSSRMLALHRTAPIGTVIKITNPMTEKSTFAKVVGKYTENETTRDVIIVITKATADLLGALDKRFQVTIDYGIPANE